MWRALPILLWGLALGCFAGAPPDRIEAPRNLYTGYPSRAPGGLVHAVIEIPAGTNAKWEASRGGEALVWERKGGEFRVVRYLPYPANYGMVPGTLLAEAEGGDGDPLDVVVLGEARPRGAVVAARVIGVLRLLDDGERDDKLIAVDPEGPLGDATTLAALDAAFPGATRILEIWFAHYKGPGRIQTRGFGEREEAVRILEDAERAFREAAAAP